MWASWRGYLDTVNHLLKCDANVNAASEVCMSMHMHTFHVTLL